MAEAESKDSAPSTDGKQPPECYLIFSNIGKKHNLGNLVRSAVAFGVKETVVVGYHKFNVFGAKGSDKYMTYHRVDKLSEAREYLKGKGVRICGIEIMKDSKPIQSHPFSGPTAFILGNEGTGLNENQKAICDDFVYIPHYGNGTASLNVTVAASIVLHHFGSWAGYTERERDEENPEKFLVEQPDPSMAAFTEEAKRKREERARKRAAQDANHDGKRQVVSSSADMEREG